MRRGEAATTRCHRPSISSPPITWRAEMPLAAAEPKDISSVHFKEGLDYVCTQTILRGSVEGNLVQSHWWPLLCVYLSKPILLTAFATMQWRCTGLQCKYNFKSFTAKGTDPILGIRILSLLNNNDLENKYCRKFIIYTLLPHLSSSRDECVTGTGTLQVHYYLQWVNVSGIICNV